MNRFLTWINRPQTLSAAAKWARRLALLLGLAAALLLAVLAAFLWPVLSGGSGVPLLHLLDELDDQLEAILLLAAGAVLCGWIARLAGRGSRRAQPARPPEEAPDEPAQTDL